MWGVFLFFLCFFFFLLRKQRPCKKISDAQKELPFANLARVFRLVERTASFEGCCIPCLQNFPRQASHDSGPIRARQRQYDGHKFSLFDQENMFVGLNGS